jgi:hypothetical protein
MPATLTIRQEAVPIVKSSLATRRKSLEFSLQQYRARLDGFERQHQVTSEQFAVRFAAIAKVGLGLSGSGEVAGTISGAN